MVEGRRAFAAGWVRQPGRGFEFVVRAYDVDTGRVLWSQEIGLGPQCAAEVPNFARCVAKALSVHDGRVFVVGHLTRTAARSDFAVVAFEAATGAQLWESVTDPTGTGANDYAWAVKAIGGRVFVVGEYGDFSGLLLRAHDAATGEIQWEQKLPGVLNYTLKETLEADRRTVFIGGTDALNRFFIGAYDADTGKQRWQDRVTDGELTGLVLDDGPDDDRDHGNDDERVLLATGVVGCEPVTFLDCELAIRAYSPRTGRILWKRADNAAGGDWFYPRIEIGLGSVFVGGRELLGDGLYHGTIRAYQLETGRRKWAAGFDEGSGFPDSGVNDLAVFEGRLYAGGHLRREDGDFDFVVRAYQPR